MKRKSVFWIALFSLALGMILVVSSFVKSQEILTAQGMMENNRLPGSMMGGNDMGTIHQLFANHNQIYRTVKDIPGGIQAVTESPNPQITALIQSHVSKMYQRIETGQTFPMIHMAPSLPAMFRNADAYQRQLQLTAKGIIVTETSSDPEMVTIIREHAREVSNFVEEGMPAMMGN